MKKLQKYIFLFFVFIVSLFFVSQTSAFLSDDLGDDLYKTLDKSSSQLSEKMFTKEITENGTKEPYEVLNSYTNTECFNKNTIIKESPDIGDFMSYIKDECKNKDGSINTLKYNTLSTGLNNFVQTKKETAENKTKSIYEISRIGLYSDGTTSNSPFDIIFDLQQIDKIIFGEDLEYNGEDLDFLEKYNRDPLNYFIDKVDTLRANKNTQNTTDNNTGNINKDVQDYIIDNPDGNNYLCTNFSDNSGLNKNEINKLVNTKYNNLIKLPDTNKIDTPLFNYKDSILPIEKTGYKKRNDNSVWPCNDFFCIKIDFTTYNQELLGYGPTKSIKAILEISNGHLKKVLSTSLQQAKQATNNFELSLFNINLSEMFHMGFNISFKPVPLLNLENKIDSKPEKQEDIEFELKKQLAFYYKNLGMDYERVNDLSIFTKKAYDKINIINSAELEIANVTKKNEELDNISEEKKENINRSSNTTDLRITNDILNDFDKQFNELEIFVESIKDYAINNQSIIKGLRDIPINKK